MLWQNKPHLESNLDLIQSYSSPLIQNLDLRALLKWRDHPVDIRDILAKIMRTGGEEIVKFLQDILGQN